MPNIYQQAVKKFGVKSQLLQTMEELAELIVANEQLNENYTVENLDNFAEETADVLIMFEQVDFIFNDCLANSVNNDRKILLSESCALAIKAIDKYNRVICRDSAGDVISSISRVRDFIEKFPDYGLGKIEAHKKLKLERLSRLLREK